jgi:hypothetical protein
MNKMKDGIYVWCKINGKDMIEYILYRIIR